MKRYGSVLTVQLGYENRIEPENNDFYLYQTSTKSNRQKTVKSG